METNDKIQKVGQPTQKSQPSLQNIGQFSSALYRGELTPLCVIECTKKLKDAFPSLPAGFYDILNDRIIDNNFSDFMLRFAVNMVIDTCKFPTPTIADIITAPSIIQRNPDGSGIFVC